METQDQNIQEIKGENKLDTRRPGRNFVLPALVVFSAILVVGTTFLLYQSKKQMNDVVVANQDLKRQVETLEDANRKAKMDITQAEAELKDIAKKTCKGVWTNGVCIQSRCVDSDVNEKPLDIYIKGTVVYTDENGVDTTVYDECSGSKLQVNEMWCYESPSGSGNYVQGKMVYDCPNGCLDGACTK